MKPPAEIDGAEVLYWAWSEPEPIFVMPFAEREGGIAIHGLAICRYAKSGDVYKFSCDRNWETCNDSPWGSVEAAMRTESGNYDVRSIRWQSM